jgi:hypothetical protein
VEHRRAKLSQVGEVQSNRSCDPRSSYRWEQVCSDTTSSCHSFQNERIYTDHHRFELVAQMLDQRGENQLGAADGL